MRYHYYNSSFTSGVCRDCFKCKGRRFMLSPSLCKKCGAKRREIKPNPLINLGGVVITTAVEKRLREQSEKAIPLTVKDYIGKTTIYISFLAILYLFFTGKGEIMDFYFQATGISVVAFTLNFLLGRERCANINSKLKSLALEREKILHEQRRFYVSAEWRKIRREIIQQHKNVCADCRRTIRKRFDITVDHIKPRSKFPELALQIQNLRVLCRPCNSAKGAKCI